MKALAEPLQDKRMNWKSSKRFAALILTFIILLLVRDVGGVALPKYIFIGIACLIFISDDPNQMIAFFAFITPLCRGISYTYMILLSLVFILIKNKRFDYDASIIFPLVIIFLEMINSLLSPSDTVLEFVRTISIICLVSLLFLDKSRSYDYQFILKMYLLGFTVLTFFTLYWTSQTTSLQEYLKSGLTLGTKILSDAEGTIIFAGNNDMGLYATMAIAISLLLILMKAGSRVVLSAIIILGFTMGFISTSRTFVLSTTICIISYIAFTLKNPKRFLRMLVLLVIFALIFYIMINTVLHDAYITFLKKMSISDISNGRFFIFRFYHDVFMGNAKIFLMGVGLQNYISKCAAPYRSSVHNATQEVLIAWGMIGLFAVVGFFTALYRNAVRLIPKHQRTSITLVPAATFILYVQFNQLFSVRNATIVLIVAYCGLALSPYHPQRGEEE